MTSRVSLSPAERARLEEVFGRYAGIQAVYLFGSRSRGKAKRESDFDFAVVPRSKEITEKRLDLLGDLTAAGFDRVDLVFLTGEDLFLQYEAVKANVRVYEAPEFRSGEFFSRSIRKYLDFLPTLKPHREALKRRLQRGR